VSGTRKLYERKEIANTLGKNSFLLWEKNSTEDNVDGEN
jgi:hypothetical protein